MLKRTDTASYTWTSRDLTLEHADPATAARVQQLRVEHAPPGVLRGIERFTGLGVLEVIADAPLDLAPLCAGLRELYAVELELRAGAGVTGEHGLAKLPVFSDLTVTGDAQQLPTTVALAWEQIGSPDNVRLVARGAAFVVDVTPLGALASLECLVGDRVVLGPRDMSGEAFAALLPPRVWYLHSANAGEDDIRRLADAWAARPPPPRGAQGEPGFSSYNLDRVSLDASAVTRGMATGHRTPMSDHGRWSWTSSRYSAAIPTMARSTTVCRRCSKSSCVARTQRSQSGSSTTRPPRPCS